MKMGTVLSTASVARQMREWFGDRDEPSIEQTVGGSVKRVVVDVEPVPSNFDMMTLSGPIDKLLDTMQPAQPGPVGRGGARMGQPHHREHGGNARSPVPPGARGQGSTTRQSDAFINDDSATILDDPGRTPPFAASTPSAPRGPAGMVATSRLPPVVSTRTLRGKVPSGSINVPAPAPPPSKPPSPRPSVPTQPDTPRRFRPGVARRRSAPSFRMILLGMHDHGRHRRGCVGGFCSGRRR